MKKLYKFILRIFIGPFILTFFIALFILIMQFLWRYIDDFVGKGLELNVIFEFLFYTALTLVPLALPLALLLSSLMTFGNLGERYELLALKAAGISLQRIMKPLIFFTIIICVFAFYFANETYPYANLKMRSLLYDVQKQRPELQIKEGVFYNGIEGYSIRINKRNLQTNLLTGIMIYDHTGDKGNISVTVADSGYMNVTEDERYIVVTLYDGYNYNEMVDNDSKNKRNKTFPHRKDKFEEQKFLIELSGFDLERTDESLFKNSYQMMDLQQLDYFSDSLRQASKTHANKIINEYHRINIFKKRNLDTPVEQTKIERDLPQRKNRLIVGNRLDHHEEIIDTVENQSNTSIVTSVDSTIVLDMDSLFHHSSRQEKSRIMQDAISNVRNTQGTLSNNKIVMENREKRIIRCDLEKHRKFTLSFACLIFFFIGAPLGAIIRKGGLGLPVVISIIFFILYYVITISTEKLARELIWNSFFGMWTASAILLPVGIFLTYKATTDSVMMNTETYVNLFKRLFKVDDRSLAESLISSKMDFQSKSDSKDEILTSLNKVITDSDKIMQILKKQLTFKGFISVYFKQQNRNYLDEFYTEYRSLYMLIRKSDYNLDKNIKVSIDRFPNLNVSDYVEPAEKAIINIMMITLLLPVGLVYVPGRYFKIIKLWEKFNNISKLCREIKLQLQSL